ncbi:MAG: hypothetical protein AB1758_30890, partial [Candidatus Eremiobacterota bacterium]
FDEEFERFARRIQLEAERMQDALAERGGSRDEALGAIVLDPRPSPSGLVFGEDELERFFRKG